MMISPKKKNRRRGPYTLVKIVTIFSVCTWLIIIVVMFIYVSYKPSYSSSSYFYKHVSATGSGIGITGAKLLLFLNLLLCIWGIIANMLRNRRKTDRIRLSLVVSTILSFIGFILIMVL